ncbi:type VI secretion system baseplate subunit TssE [Desulfogranum mediterraneum]|uniref:type VI secretion system baseplate subunit TssE n=1 Tax=Desulfogranum mediterraneum TaxID=160661 RepID=UPI000428B2D7|nr:type VI secretion system baseplate subunit TssE [Desulfogranum mediterraneum]
MILQERLLERIGRLEEPEPQQPLTPSARQVNSIIAHLLRLLNTRQGSVTIAPDFGVPDMTNIPGDSIQEARQRIEEVIQEVVQKYEPRLKDIRLIMQHEDQENFSLRFRLEANLAEQEEIPVIFETVVSTEGKISISS